jgi:hypothetical protein
MLTVGLVTQIMRLHPAVHARSGVDGGASVAWVVVAQGICGVAKDLTKTASKSAIKITQAQARENAGAASCSSGWPGSPAARTP